MHHTISTALIALAASSLSLGVQAKSPAQWQALTSNLQVSLEQAIGHATQAVPGKVLEIELDDGDGAGVRYEAQVLTPAGDSVEVWVDGSNGQARQHEHDGKAKRKDVQRAQEAKIDITQAIKAATSHTPGKAIKAELDNHWGTVSYQVDVLQADHTVMEVKLNAADGSVIRAKRD
ncbi:MAG TPA: PepSY domain-containing protein [Comamonas sp.]|uniref:PepSY domain-containing protein n=1 Tax=Comamonas halotolerans TaxID=3041496 RepID=UPI0024E09476|nr:PepSY domain-containing protein [Comamonas sp. NoAH]